MKDESHQSESPLAIGFEAVVRLIILDPGGNVLLARYPVAEGDAVLDQYTYWSFLGLPNFRIIGHESIVEAVVRVADRQLGMQIAGLERVSCVHNRRAYENPPKLVRVYYWAHTWNGELPAPIMQPDHEENQGLYDWVAPAKLQYYVSRRSAETYTAIQRWKKLIREGAGA